MGVDEHDASSGARAPHANEGAGSDIKKPYQRPRLQTYGSFLELTRVVTKGGRSQDGGGKPSTRAGGPPS